MSRRVWFGRWLRRRERGLKKLCISLIIAAFVGGIAGPLAPGGLNGTIGPIVVMVAILAMLLALPVALLWALCGIMGNVASLVGSNQTASWCATDHVSRDQAPPAAVEAFFAESLAVRGIESVSRPSPAQRLELLREAAETEPFTSDEAARLWLTTVDAAVRLAPHKGNWQNWQAAQHIFDTAVPPVHIDRAIDPENFDFSPEKRGSSAPQRAYTVDAIAGGGFFERNIGHLGLLALVGLGVVRSILAATKPAGIRSPTPSWALSLLVAFGLLLILNAVLKWRRRRAAAWSITPTPAGMQARPAHAVGSGVEVDAQRCWVWIGRAHPARLGFPSTARWWFFFPEEPGALMCDGFDPSGTPWQGWIEEFNAANEAERRELSEPIGQSNDIV